MSDSFLKIKQNSSSKTALSKLFNISTDIQTGMRKALFDIGKDLLNEAKKETRKHKSGVKYRNLRNRSSAPGESHRDQSGNLIRSAGWKVSGFDSLTFGYGVTKTAPKYARFIEEGTPRGKIKPRPTLKNTIKAIDRDITGNLTREVNKTLRK